MNWLGPSPAALRQVSFQNVNGDLPIAERPDSIHIPPENLFEIKDDSGIAIRECLRHFVEKIFPDINANFHAPKQQLIFG